MNRLLRPPRRIEFSAVHLRADLRASAVDGACYSLMVGLGETCFGAFFIAAGIGNFWVGMLATWPLLLGSLFQLLTPWGIRRFGSYRNWSVLMAGSQGLSLLALAAACFFGQLQFPTLLLLLALHWGSSMAVGPAWNTWMEFVIPRSIRTRYLSRRMRICQVCLLLAVTGSGLLLRSGDGLLLVFAGLFATGGLLRLVSAACLNRQTEQPGWLAAHERLKLMSGGSREVSAAVWQTVPFFVAIQFAVYVSGPYFAPFMLRDQGVDFRSYTFLIVLGYLGRVLMLRLAGEIARRWGPGRLLWLGSVGLVPLAGLWIFHESYLFLAISQVVGGAAWACYELATSLVFIERIPGHQRTRVLSLFGVGNGLAMVGGSLVGGWLISGFGNATSGFLAVFILSSVLRLAALLLFPRKLFAIPSPALVRTPEHLVTASPHLNGRPTIRPLASVGDSTALNPTSPSPPQAA